MFLIYLNGVAKPVDCAKCALFADDTNNFIEWKTISDLYVLESQAVLSYNSGLLLIG